MRESPFGDSVGVRVQLPESIADRGRVRHGAGP
jgi:hypothetical protein